MDDAITQLYSGKDQTGGSLPYFAGGGGQWGGGILSSIGRFAFPILKRVLGIATNTAADVLVHKKKFKDSIIDNTMNEVKEFISSPKTINPDDSLSPQSKRRRRR